jgi:hypothetical protein
VNIYHAREILPALLQVGQKNLDGAARPHPRRLGDPTGKLFKEFFSLREIPEEGARSGMRLFLLTSLLSCGQHFYNKSISAPQSESASSRACRSIRHSDTSRAFFPEPPLTSKWLLRRLSGEFLLLSFHRFPKDVRFDGIHTRFGDLDALPRHGFGEL